MIIKDEVLTIVRAFGILMAAATLTIKLVSVSGIQWWLGITFCYALFFAAMYEISIKPVLKTHLSIRWFFIKIVLPWFIPLFFGYGLGRFLNHLKP